MSAVARKVSPRIALISAVRAHARDHYPADWQLLIEATSDASLADIVGGARSTVEAIERLESELQIVLA